MSMSNPTNHVEVITSVQRRRRWTASEKVRMVEETFEPGMTVSLVARRRGVAPNQLFTWRRLVAQGSLTAAGSGEELCRRPIIGRCRTKFVSFIGYSARKPWKPRFSRRRSSTPPAQKTYGAPPFASGFDVIIRLSLRQRIRSRRYSPAKMEICAS